MLLAIDTATRWLGLALHDGDAVVAEVGWRAVNTQTVELAPALADVLARVKMRAEDLTAIGIAIGPGSYTGLRIGLGFAKGIALAWQLPLIGVPTLDVVAAGIGRRPGQLVAITEAGRTRVNAGIYRFHRSRGWQIEGQPGNYSWDGLLDTLKGKHSFGGEVSPAARKLIRKRAQGWQIIPAASSTRRAGNLAQLCWNRFKKGDVDDAAALSPLYLRDVAGNPTSN